MSRSTVEAPEAIRSEKKKIVLVGNPNAGKSVVFNAMTGLYVDVSNYPGTTLDISSSEIEQGILVDTPGIYGISSFNDEERIAKAIILGADVVINVVNALYLERDLFLTQQIIDAQIPMIVALNMMDEAERSGLEIDVQKLSALLGVPVIPTVGIRRKGIDELLRRIPEASVGHQTPGLDKLLDSIDRFAEQRNGDKGTALVSKDIPVSHRLLILEDDAEIAEKEGFALPGCRETVYKMRRDYVNRIVNQVVKDHSKSTLGEIIGRLSVQPLTGIPALIACLWIIYKVMGSFVATTVVEFTEGTIMAGLYEPWMRSLVSRITPVNSTVWNILVGEFGVLTMTPIYVFGLLTPLVLGFYIFISILEDSGYLPRIATLSDRVFGSIGLNGKAIIPMILGFGCVTMATVTTRMLATQKEKRIAVFLLGLAIPCSAQLGIISSVLSQRGMGYLAIYVVTIIIVFMVVGALLKAIVPGMSSSLLLDLPPMRVPSLSNVLKKAFTRTYHFITEATPLFAAGAVLIGVMDASGVLQAIQGVAEPIVVHWLKLPREAATAFIMGFIRRDFGAAGLTLIELTDAQALTAMVTMSLFVPCIASVLIMVKERGKLEALAMWIGAFVIALATGGILTRILDLVQI